MHTTNYRPHYTQEQLDAVRLIRSHNIGSGIFHQLLALHGSASKALKAVPEMAKRGGAKSPVLASEETILAELAACKKLGATLLTLNDPFYPQLLRTLDYPPPVLTVHGNLDLLNQNSVAIVGARNASANGYRFAYHLGKTLTPHYIVVSGLARGIDTAAHQGALEAGKTVAVTACGIDITYPDDNQSLSQHITERGIIVTEMPFGTLPKSQNFPKRNRIISGLSLGTVVVEASLKSGSLITANMAIDQNRDVFAVPGSPLDPRSQGTNYLIKQGAHLVNATEDIIEVLQHSTLVSMVPSLNSTHIPSKTPIIHNISNIEHIHTDILQKLSPSPTDINDIIVQTDLTAGHIFTILLELELAGKIKRYPGNKISLHSESI
jgi:DNA processing protein